MMGRESVGITARLQAWAPVLFVGTIVTHLMIGKNPWSRLSASSVQGNLFLLFLLFIILGVGSHVALHAIGRTRTAANFFLAMAMLLGTVPVLTATLASDDHLAAVLAARTGQRGAGFVLRRAAVFWTGGFTVGCEPLQHRGRLQAALAFVVSLGVANLVMLNRTADMKALTIELPLTTVSLCLGMFCGLLACDQHLASDLRRLFAPSRLCIAPSEPSGGCEQRHANLAGGSPVCASLPPSAPSTPAVMPPACGWGVPPAAAVDPRAMQAAAASGRLYDGADDDDYGDDTMWDLPSACAAGRLETAMLRHMSGECVHTSLEDGMSAGKTAVCPGWRHRPIGRLAAFRPAAQADLSLSCLRPCQRPPLNHRHGAHAPRVRQWAPARRTGALITSLDLAAYRTVSYLASSSPLSPPISQWLLSCGASLEVLAPDGSRPLHLACASGESQLVQWLVRQGACTLATDSHGYTAVHIAAARGAARCVMLLLAHAAQPPARSLAARAPTRRPASALAEHVHAVAHDGTQPLHLACRHGSLECVQVLVKCSADPHSSTALHGFSPLQVAYASGSQQVMVCLNRALAESKAKR